MPFVSPTDFKVLDVSVRYCKLSRDYEKSNIKTGELDFGKWLVELLYKRQRMEFNKDLSDVIEEVKKIVRIHK